MPDDDTNGRGPSGGERDGKVDEIRAADANAPGEKPEDAKRGRRSNARDRLLEARKITGPVDATLFTLPPGFARHNDGYWRQPGEGKTPFRVCGLFGVVAETRPEDGNEWGLLLDWEDRDGTLHEWIMPRRLLVGEAVEVRARLAAGGLFVGASDGARRALVELLANVAVPARVRIVPQTGWYRPNGGGACFVLPGGNIGNVVGEVVRLELDPPPSIYRKRGDLDGWRQEVARRCRGNSRLLFGVSCGFAAPLLPLIGDEGGGFNLRGESSKGKTGIVDAAASVWGAPSKSGPDSFVRQWRSTANALETTASAHNHVLLPMDELGQADAREVPEVLYMLANGSGKERARAGGGNRKPTTWLTLVLSSSEESAARIAEAVGRRIKAGQEVRLIDLPAVVPGAHGCFEDLHDAADGKAFSQAMRSAVLAHHGSAAPAFVSYLAAELAADADAAARIGRRVAELARQMAPSGADGQVQRAAQRFAVVGVAGELASEAGITGWPGGEAAGAAWRLFRDWLAERGGIGSREDQALFAVFRRFIVEHGAARFEPLRAQNDDGSQVEPSLTEGARTMLRAGWRWQEANEIGERRWVYGMDQDVFANEIAGKVGLEAREAQARLGKAGMIRGKIESGKQRWTDKRRIPGHGRPRLIIVDPATMDAEEGPDEQKPDPAEQGATSAE